MFINKYFSTLHELIFDVSFVYDFMTKCIAYSVFSAGANSLLSDTNYLMSLLVPHFYDWKIWLTVVFFLTIYRI